MRQHAIIARLGPRDAAPVTAHMTQPVQTEIRFIDGYRRLGFGLGHMVDQLAARGIVPSETALDLAILAACVTAEIPASRVSRILRTAGHGRSTSMSPCGTPPCGQERAR